MAGLAGETATLENKEQLEVVQPLNNEINEKKCHKQENLYLRPLCLTEIN